MCKHFESLLPILEMMKEFIIILLKFVKVIWKLNENIYMHFNE